MDLDFTSEQTMLRESAASFFNKECSYNKLRELEESQEGYDPNLWQKMSELGWLGIPFPERYGGYAGSFLDLVILLEEMGKKLFPSPFFSTVINAGTLIMEGGTEDQKKIIIPQIVDGSMILTLAQYEEDGCYDHLKTQMRAQPEGNGFVLNGTKLFVMDANVASLFMVVAKTGNCELSLFLVDSNSPGISITKMPTIGKDNNCEVVFKRVKVSKKDILGFQGKGAELIDKMNARAAVAKAAEMIGGCRSCIDITTKYAKERIQYDKPIGVFQAIQHYMANMQVEYDTNQNYLYRTASMIDNGEDFAVHASALKASANECFKYISERSVQIHGAIGTTRECDIGLFYRKAKAHEYLCGDTDLHYEKVFEYLLAQQ